MASTRFLQAVQNESGDVMENAGMLMLTNGTLMFLEFQRKMRAKVMKMTLRG